MKIPKLLVALLATFALLTAACGDDDDGVASSGDAGSADTTTTTEGDTTDAQCPIGNVTWFEALAFANLRSQRHEPPLPPCYALHDCSGDLGRGMHRGDRGGG